MRIRYTGDLVEFSDYIKIHNCYDCPNMYYDENGMASCHSVNRYESPIIYDPFVVDEDCRLAISEGGEWRVYLTNDSADVAKKLDVVKSRKIKDVIRLTTG